MKISVALLHVDSPFARGEASRAARAILADLLRKNGIPCDAADLDRDERGRPYFTDPALHREIDFNLSHTDKTVAVAIAIRENEGETPRVGIDVEVPHPRIRKKQLAARFFSKNEIALLDESADEEAAFLSIWTRKEAYLKYRGTGLAGEMQTADTTLPSSLSVTLLTYPLRGMALSLCLSEGVAPPRAEDFLVYSEIPETPSCKTDPTVV